MTRFAWVIYSAMNAFVPQAQHAYREKPIVTDARYVSIAQDVSDVVEENDGTVDEGIRLVSIAGYESAYRADIDKCQVPASAPSFTIFQISTHRKYACADRKNAVRVALYRMRESFAVCDKLDFADRLSFYATGKCQHSWYSRSRVQRAERFIFQALDDMP